MSVAVGSESAATERREAGAVAFFERLLRHLVEVPAAAIVLAEIGILFAGVVARFALHRPIVWSDELASILFLWLAMLGSVIALQRGQHMRLTAVVTSLPPRAQVLLEVLAVGASALFLAAILPQAAEYAEDEWFIETPALGWSNMIRAGAIPVGCALMLATCAVRLLRQRALDLLIVAAGLGVIAALFWLLGPAIKGMGHWNLIVFFVGLLMFGVLSGVPIGFSFGLATLAYLSTTTSVPLTVIVSRMDEGMSSLILLAVPLFVFLGVLIEMTGMAKAMVDFLASLLGHVRGGLSYVLLGAMYLVSGISGAKAADMAAVAPVLFPEMRRRGSNEGEMVSLLSASGAMSETIPPSLVLITIGSVTGVSIAALFTGGLLPGFVLALALAVIAWRRSRDEDMSGVQRPSAGVILKALLVALPALVLPFLIRAAVVEGVATATEVSTIGIGYAVIAGLLFYRSFDWRRIYPMLVETAALSGAILLIIGTATGMAWALTQSGFSRDLAAAMQAMPGGRWGFLLVSILAFIVLGSILEGIPAIVLFGPLLFPIARQLGVDEVHYAIVVILAMGLGLFAPPFGVGYYAACAIGRVSPDAAMRRIWPYMGALLVGLLVVAAVPWISTGFLGR
ncbi:TRAP transporter large permease subunit [Roseomonas sp. KE2513]|uniref:TRAP transporter large permease n=1 Tax=Roseomonas sp. KE2513 TaxID=2479202 RepID=UPI0018E04CFA|nr:TRAP transporter large permease subunit [Roseomonas sp. KE2513]MBI0537901.1 TRAP transporter large permease subunit [Roseomonas sp. KE2513]